MSQEQDTTEEEWRPVVGHEGAYEVSDAGRVRCLPRVVGNERKIRRRGRTLKQTPHSSGRLTVGLYANAHRSMALTHRLVLSAFVGPPPAGMVCCHNDGICTNNRLSNLRWDTRAANAEDSRQHGTLAVGERQGSAVLTEKQVVEIRTRYADGGVSQKGLAKAFGVAEVTIWKVIHRKSWSHVQ